MIQKREKLCNIKCYNTGVVLLEPPYKGITYRQSLITLSISGEGELKKEQ